MRPLLRRGSGLAAAILALWLATPAMAERIWIMAGGDERGQGWLFGSSGANPGECWIATPSHVVLDPYTQEPRPFVFTDQNGVSGESERPIVATDIVDSQGLRDLAFARVAFGRERGKCRSGLGLNRLAYDTALRSSPDLTVFDLLPTSVGIFTARVDRSGLVNADGRLSLTPVEPAASVHLKRGLSGAVAELPIAGVPEPFAMVQDVIPDETGMIALRFDLIRHAFEQMEAASNGIAEISKERHPYDLISLEGTSTEGSPADLQADGENRACWRAMAAKGAPGIRLIISVPESESALQWLRLGQSPECNADGATITLDARVGDQSAWSRLSDCHLEKAGYRCRANLHGPRQLRINISGPVNAGFDELELR